VARLVLTDASIVINSINLSDFISSVTLSTSDDVVETSAFSSAIASGRTRVAGLQDNSVTLEFFQDFGTSLVEQTIYPLIGSATNVVVKPTSAAVSATNPSYSFSTIIVDWQSLSGSVGELATASVTWPISGSITKATV
jgi:hypothetical protein